MMHHPMGPPQRVYSAGNKPQKKAADIHAAGILEETKRQVLGGLESVQDMASAAAFLDVSGELWV